MHSHPLLIRFIATANKYRIKRSVEVLNCFSLVASQILSEFIKTSRDGAASHGESHSIPGLAARPAPAAREKRRRALLQMSDFAVTQAENVMADLAAGRDGQPTADRSRTGAC
jgi:hypothetical protein